MTIIELDQADADRLEQVLTDAGHDVRLVREEGYFGDAPMASLIVESSTAILNLIAASLSAWSAGRAIRASVNGQPQVIAEAAPDEVLAKISPEPPPETPSSS